MFAGLKVAAIAIALAGLACGAMAWRLNVVTGQRDAARTELASYEAAAAAVIKERLATQERERVENVRKTREVTDAYQKRIAGLDARLVAALERLRGRPAEGGSADAGVPAAPATPGGIDGAPGEPSLVGEAAGCLKIRAQLEALQDWIRGTH